MSVTNHTERYRLHWPRRLRIRLWLHRQGWKLRFFIAARGSVAGYRELVRAHHEHRKAVARAFWFGDTAER